MFDIAKPYPYPETVVLQYNIRKNNTFEKGLTHQTETKHKYNLTKLYMHFNIYIIN